MRHAASPTIESDGSNLGLLAVAVALVLVATVIIPLARFFRSRSR